jgi:hypothetical protein
MDPGRQLAIDDLGIRAGQSCRKSIPGLRGGLTDSGFGNSAALGRAAAEASNASHQDDANGCQQGCCQARGTAASRRPESRPFLDSSVAAPRLRINGAHRHDEASFFLPKGIPGPNPRDRASSACMSLGAERFGGMSKRGCAKFQLLLSAKFFPSEPAHTRSGSVGISVPGAYPIRSCDKAPCRPMAASSRILSSSLLGMFCAILPLVEQQ